MALQLGALYQALLKPGDPDLAQKAAEEVAAYDSRLASLDGRLLVLTWMVGTNIVLTIGLFWMVFNILSRLP